METMKTAVFQVDFNRADTKSMDDIAGVLGNGGVIVYPTDTFYGLGVDCFSAKAVNRVFQLKGRESKKPLPVIIGDMGMLDDVAVHIPRIFKRIAEKFWPGPLTVVFQAAERIPRELHAGTGSIAVRLPDHPWLRRLVLRAGMPITATSANLSGEKEIWDPGEIKRLFSGRVACIVDGGPAPGGKPSTVLDLRGNPQILREGALPTAFLNEYLFFG